MSAELGVLERLGERLNPILVKEVRQALRGRYFRISFWFTLLAASVASLGYLVFQSDQGFDASDGRPLGVAFFTINFACIAIATHGLVPFSAFVAMGSEWDESTYDLLVLSNLRPRQIVAGKVLAAGVQALLFYSAFGPFLVFAFLLRGVDLTALLVALGGSMVLSFALSCFAVALSSLTQQRFARIVLMGLLAAFLVTGVATPSISTAAYLVRFPGQLHEPGALAAIGGFMTLLASAGLLFVLIGAARIAHPEENRSTALRVYVLALAVASLFWVAGMQVAYFGMVEEELLAFALLCQVFLATAALFFATEPDGLGRRVRGQVPRSRALSLLAAPFLPGGGRGLVWYVLANVLVVLWLSVAVFLARSVGGHRIGLTPAQWSVPVVAAAYGIVYIGIPSLAFARSADQPRTRIGARVTAAFLFMASIVVPAVVGFFVGAPEWMEFRHRANPAHVLWKLARDDAGAVPLAAEGALAAAVLVLAANLPRLARSLAEVRRARRERAERVATVPVELASGT